MTTVPSPSHSVRIRRILLAERLSAHPVPQTPIRAPVHPHGVPGVSILVCLHGNGRQQHQFASLIQAGRSHIHHCDSNNLKNKPGSKTRLNLTMRIAVHFQIHYASFIHLSYSTLLEVGTLLLSSNCTSSINLSLHIECLSRLHTVVLFSGNFNIMAISFGEKDRIIL